MATSSAQFSLTLGVELPHESGTLGKVTAAIAEAGGAIAAVDTVEAHGDGTPGVARICLAIAEHPQKAFDRGSRHLADEELAGHYIIPSVFNREVSREVARAVAEEAERTGEVREPTTDTAELSLPS